MKSSLVIDHGNSSLKVYVFQGDDYMRGERISSVKELEGFLGETKPSDAVFASSGKIEEDEINEISKIIGFRPLVFNQSTPLPIRLHYDTPETLGLDRIAGVVAAVAQMEEGGEVDFILVADAGTALTLDIARKGEGFMGGNISAGIALKLKALHSFTAALPEISIEGKCPEFGTDTVTAMRSGAIRGTIAEIESAFRRASLRYGKGCIVLTGGDAEIIKKYIDSSLPVKMCPILVAEGLNRILYYNENIHKAN